MGRFLYLQQLVLRYSLVCHRTNTRVTVKKVQTSLNVTMKLVPLCVFFFLNSEHLETCKLSFLCGV